MTVEGNHHRQAVLLLGIRHRPANHLLMAEMNPVKHPDGHAHLAATCDQFRRRLNDIHGLEDSARPHGRR